jgi:rubrerythrin
MTKTTTLTLLAEGRKREKTQTLFYRRLASLAEDTGDEALAERLNGLHADEQHHLSRLTARLLELGGEPAELGSRAGEGPELEGWEDEARRREEGEVAWYTRARDEDVDDTTRDLLDEILHSERHHARELGGKWMSA